MYNFNILANKGNEVSAQKAMEILKKYCPDGNAALSSTSTLAKLLSWHLDSPVQPEEVLLHQADYASNCLVNFRDPGSVCVSDWNNVLKLGYDVQSLSYPDWLLRLLHNLEISPKILPRIIAPGDIVGPVDPSLIEEWGLHESCQVVAGTTDSIAAFLASGVNKPGQAVTSLGSTLAIKALSSIPVEDSHRGIYSHRLGDQWLVGGASNVGCAVLRSENFSDRELMDLSEAINPYEDSQLSYYPLVKPGERFPVNDPMKAPVLEPKPVMAGDESLVDRRAYLHGILQSIARIEAEGYAALEELGASPITEVQHGYICMCLSGRLCHSQSF